MQGIGEERAKEKKQMKKREAEIDDNVGGSDGNDSLKFEKKKKKKKSKNKDQQKAEHGGQVCGMGEILVISRDKDLKETAEMVGPKGKEKKRKEGKSGEQMGSDKSKVDNPVGSAAGEVDADNGGKKEKKKSRDKKDSFGQTDGDKIEYKREKLDENAEVEKKMKKKKKLLGGDYEATDSTAHTLFGKIVDNETKQLDERPMEGVQGSGKDAKKKKSKKDKKKSSDLAAENQAEGESTRKEGGCEGDQRDGKLVENAGGGHDSTGKKTKKRKQIDDSGFEEDTGMSNKETKKKRKKSQNKDSGPGENIVGPDRDAEKKRKRKQKQRENAEDETPSSSKSAKKVKFSDQVEVFHLSDDVQDAEDKAEEEEEEEEGEEAGLVRGKRFSKEEDEIVRQAVLDYVDNHGLGKEGINMVLQCQSHREVRNCWREIGEAIPWRPRESVYYRAHILFERDSNKSWSQEDLELVKRFAEKHGSNWRTLADAVGKHRLHVKDAWRRLKLPNLKKGKWSREEYQTLFDLVNLDLRMKAFEEKKSKHGMLRDNIPWSAISDKLGTRNHSVCCMKWYDQLTSPMVKEGTWDNADDYRLLDELLKLDACCIEDVDWDNLLENRSGDVCRKRWNQMVHHIGQPETKSFPDQVEILANRYNPDLAELREEFDNRPYVP